MPHGGSVLSTCPRRDETRSDDCASLRVISFTPRGLAKACRFCLCCTQFCPRDRARAEAGRRGPRNQQHSPAGERERSLTMCKPCSRSTILSRFGAHSRTTIALPLVLRLCRV